MLVRGTTASSASLNASRPWAKPPPARIAVATQAVSASSASLAPALTAFCACESMQYVHCVVMPTARAMSSRNFSGMSRPSAANTALSKSTHARRMSGVSAL